MKITLLLDLDNTLLENDMASFLGSYFQALSRKFQQWPREKFIQKLLAATQVMINKREARFTLEQAFDQVFYPSLGIQKSEIRAELDTFYTGEFGNLGSLTRPRPQAKHLINQARDAGAYLAVATNPVFPKKAIQHRLRWAGFSDLSIFQLVTSYEGMHFSKPNPEYYAEVLAQLGCPDQPAVMIGDSLDEDLLPAAKMGIAGYLVTDHPVRIPSDTYAPIHQGPLEMAWEWIQKVSSQLDPPGALGAHESVLATITATPAALETKCAILSPADWRKRPQPQEWAANEILCHLRDVDREVNSPRFRQIANEDSPFLPGMVTDPWAEERGYIKQSGPAALQAFMDIRCDISELLRRMPSLDWQRTARHAIFGPTTLLELVRFVATHDIAHIRQIFQTLSMSSQAG